MTIKLLFFLNIESLYPNLQSWLLNILILLLSKSKTSHEIKTSFNELGQSSIPAYLGNIPKAVHSYESNSSFLLNYSGTLGQKINFYL